jgi:hypothetical protein
MKRYESFNAGIEEWDTGEFVLYDDIKPLIDAVANLLTVKGRHHTEIAYQRLDAAFRELGEGS